MEKVFSSFYFLGYTEVGTVGEKKRYSSQKKKKSRKCYLHMRSKPIFNYLMFFKLSLFCRLEIKSVHRYKIGKRWRHLKNVAQCAETRLTSLLTEDEKRRVIFIKTLDADARMSSAGCYAIRLHKEIRHF